jgi:hypothetical protein
MPHRASEADTRLHVVLEVVDGHSADAPFDLTECRSGSQRRR